jgi:DNA-binding NarL/FixJ family response regulator
MKVLLVDDHALFREGLALLLQTLMGDIEVSEAGSGQEAIEFLAGRTDIDLILFDIGLPDMNGTDAIGLVRTQNPNVPIVALSSSEDKETVLKALDQGAMGFVPKSSSSPVLSGALRLILNKGIYLPPSVFLGDRYVSRPTIPVGRPAQNVSPSPATTPAALGLTPRQIDVLYRILQGKSAKVISRELDLASGTVKTHTSAVLRALNVTTRTQAIIAAGRLGLRFDDRPDSLEPPRDH